jgi:hypothetical protein
MEPVIPINYLAVLACVIVAMVLGFLWFGPLFGKLWARHMGMEDMEKPSSGEMNKSLVLMAFSSFLIAFVYAHTQGVWRAGAWGLSPDMPSHLIALNSAFFTWAGFFFPMQITRVAWEGKSWGLVAVNTSYDLVRLLAFAFILAYWR